MDVSILYQIAYVRNSSLPTICFRCKDSGLWSDWKEISTDIPAFYKNYADLAALTIGVQGFSYQDLRTTHADLNNLPMHNIFTSLDSTSANVPTGLNYGHIIHFAYAIGSTHYVVQIVFQFEDNGVWFRSKWGDSWKPWKAIQLVS